MPSYYRAQATSPQKPVTTCFQKFHYDDEILQQYNTILNAGYSFGAYDGDLLVGLAIAEGHQWNRVLHEAEALRYFVAFLFVNSHHG